MAEYQATVVWEREGAVFVDNRYSRGRGCSWLRKPDAGRMRRGRIRGSCKS